MKEDHRLFFCTLGYFCGVPHEEVEALKEEYEKIETDYMKEKYIKSIIRNMGEENRKRRAKK